MAYLPVEERISAYISNLEQFISKIDENKLSGKPLEVFKLAKSYLSDAKYYFEKKDYVTSLSCIAYAEGLLDALRHLGLIEGVEWKPLSELLKRPLVLVAGSFEFLHPGHLALLRKAWELGRVYVIVSRDVNFERFKKRKPVLNEKDRLEVVNNIKYVYRAVLGDTEDFLKPIVEAKPDIILLGPDQWIEPEELRERLRERGLEDVRVLKLEERVGSWSSTSIYNGLKKSLCSESLQG